MSAAAGDRTVKFGETVDSIVDIRHGAIVGATVPDDLCDAAPWARHRCDVVAKRIEELAEDIARQASAAAHAARTGRGRARVWSLSGADEFRDRVLELNALQQVVTIQERVVEQVGP